MTSWTYYVHAMDDAPQNGPARWKLADWNERCVTIGAGQLELMLRARASAGGTVALTHGRDQNKQRMAARRLVERGLLAGPNFVGRAARVRHWRDGVVPGSAASGVYIYTLTEKGRTCWLRCSAPASAKGSAS